MVAPEATRAGPPGPGSEAGDTDVDGVGGEMLAEAVPEPRRGERIRGKPTFHIDEQVMLARGTTDVNVPEPYVFQGHACAVGASDAPKELRQHHQLW